MSTWTPEYPWDPSIEVVKTIERNGKSLSFYRTTRHANVPSHFSRSGEPHGTPRYIMAIRERELNASEYAQYATPGDSFYAHYTNLPPGYTFLTYTYHPVANELGPIGL